MIENLPYVFLQGLVRGHAYSVTKVVKVKIQTPKGKQTKNLIDVLLFSDYL